MSLSQCMARGCLLFFYKNYNVYRIVYMLVSLESLVSVISLSFVCLHLHVFKIRYCLRLFIVVLQELHCLLNCLHVCMIRVRGWYHITKFCYSTPSGF